MLRLLVPCALLRALGSRGGLVLENLALSEQLAAYKARDRRPRIRAATAAQATGGCSVLRRSGGPAGLIAGATLLLATVLRARRDGRGLDR